MSIKYHTNDKGKTYATVDGHTIYMMAVTKADPWRRPSTAFTWTAKGRGEQGHGATRDEAVKRCWEKIKKKFRL